MNRYFEDDMKHDARLVLTYHIFLKSVEIRKGTQCTILSGDQLFCIFMKQNEFKT